MPSDQPRHRRLHRGLVDALRGIQGRKRRHRKDHDIKRAGKCQVEHADRSHRTVERGHDQPFAHSIGRHAAQRRQHHVGDPGAGDRDAHQRRRTRQVEHVQRQGEPEHGVAEQRYRLGAQQCPERRREGMFARGFAGGGPGPARGAARIGRSVPG